MKKVVKGILLMSILTVIYISAVVYANSNSANPNSADGWVLAADEYKEQPSSWYTPEELGIIEVIEYKDPVAIHVVVPGDICEQLFEQRPIFEYKDRFYQISETDFTPALETKGWLIPVSAVGGVCIAGGWICVGYFGLRKRREGNENRVSHNVLKPELTTLEACHRLAPIEGQKEIARRLKAVQKEQTKEMRK